MTKREYFELIATAMNDNEDVVAFCNKEIAALDARKVKAQERAAQKRAEGDALQDAVYAVVTDEFQTSNAIFDAIEGVDEVTIAKVRARLTKLVNAGLVTREEIKVTGEDGKAKKLMGYALATDAE